MLGERRKDQASLSNIHTLAGLQLDEERYEESENMEVDIKTCLERRPGRDTTQALGDRRVLVEAVWKQGDGRRKNAERLMGDMNKVIEKMSGADYEMYQADERGHLEKMENDLRKLDEERAGREEARG